MDRALIERAIESAKARIYKLEKDQEGRNTGGHFRKIENQKEVMEVTVEALERMLPKKPNKIQIPNTSWSNACTRFECPSCHKYLNYRELSHCGLCAQALDWSE